MNNYFKKIRRVDQITFFVILFILIILLRSFNLQFTESEKYSSLIKNYEIKEHTISTSRGSIVDRNNIVLAESIPMKTLIISNKEKFLQDHSALKKLCKIIDIDFEYLLKIVRKKENKRFIRIRELRLLSSDNANKISRLNIKGIYFIKEFKRYYPEGETFASLIGMTNINHIGHMGLESSYDSSLAGINGKKKVMIDRQGTIVKEIKEIKKPKEGSKLVLTVDARLQYVAYRELKKQVRKVDAKSGSVIILDSTNGDILATASYPSYDPNDNSTYTVEAERNRGIIDSLEPASTIKPFVLTAALYSEKVNLSDKFNTNPGYKKMGRKTYRDISNFGELTSEGVIIKSSNLGSIMILEKFNKKIFYDLLEHVGFGEKINLNFPSEVEGSLPHHSDWKKTDVRSLAQGYHCRVSPLQLAKAYSAIANNGLVINPRLIKKNKIDIFEDKKYEKEFNIVKNVIKKVIDEGSAQRAAIHGYTAGGKTGTAELYISGKNKNKYSSEKHTGLFAGIAPLKNPKLVIVVVINQPSDEKFGGVVAAPVFKKIATDSLRILNISPDNIDAYEKKVLKKVKKQNSYTYKNPEVNNVF